MKKPTVLLILDGYGERKEKDGNAIALANTPVMDKLKKEFPYVEGQASGLFVGLPGFQWRSTLSHRAYLRAFGACKKGRLKESLPACFPGR